jgi:hypothetical protein
VWKRISESGRKEVCEGMMEQGETFFNSSGNYTPIFTISQDFIKNW